MNMLFNHTIIKGTSLVKAGGYATALIAIGTILNFAYEKNAWSADVKELGISQEVNMMGMEKRMLTRQIMQWRTKPATSNQDVQYKEAMVQQLESDKREIANKMRALRK